MDEEQYYKDKYLKYKLKYVTLKNQRGGTSAMLKAIELKKELSKEKTDFDPIKVKEYLESKFNYVWSDKNILYNKIIEKDIINQIKKTWALSIEGAIDTVVYKFFNKDNDKEALKKYLNNLIESYNQAKKEIELFKSTPIYTLEEISYTKRPDTLGKYSSDSASDRLRKYLDLRNKMIKDKIIQKIKTELSTNTYVSIDKAIDKVLQKEYPNDNDNETFKSLIWKLVHNIDK